jgi:hypothetical protein
MGFLASKRQVTNNSEGIHCHINEAETKLAGRRHDYEVVVKHKQHVPVRATNGGRV